MQEITTFIHNHLLLNIVFLGVLFSVIFVEFIKQKQNAASLTPARLTHLINHQNAVVIDTRDREAFASGHVIGALSMPGNEVETNSKKLEKFRSRPIVLVCSTGMDASRVARKLLSEDYDARVLGGGMRAWREASMPIVKE